LAIQAGSFRVLSNIGKLEPRVRSFVERFRLSLGGPASGDAQEPNGVQGSYMIENGFGGTSERFGSILYGKRPTAAKGRVDLVPGGGSETGELVGTKDVFLQINKKL